MRIVQSGAGAHFDLGDRPISAVRTAAPKPATLPAAAKPAVAQAIAAKPPVIAHSPQTRVIQSRHPAAGAGTLVANETSDSGFTRSWIALALVPLAAASLALLWGRRRNNRRLNG